MLNLTEFEENLRKELEKKVRVVKGEVTKYGYGKITSFILETDSEDVKLTIYPAVLYDEYYKSGFSVVEIVEECILALPIRPENIIIPQNKKEVLEMIMPRVLCKELFYGDFYREIPWSSDMIIAYYCEREVDSRVESFLLNYAIMKKLGFSKREVEKIAMRNVNNKEFYIEQLNREMFLALSQGKRNNKQKKIKYPMEQMEKNDECVLMFKVSNRKGVFGANMLLCEDILQMLYEYLEESYIIFPSSVHEVLLVPSGKNPSSSIELKEMVMEINKLIRVDEILSNNVYFFNGVEIIQL